MNRINNKGFTLIEVLAVVVILAILGVIATPSILNTINKGKEASYKILIDDIKIASQQLFEELEHTNNNIYSYNTEGKINDQTIKINILATDINITTKSEIEINLQTLVGNGFLTGINNDNPENKNTKIILNPKNNEDIGSCQIKIIKNIELDENYKTTYTIENLSTDNNNCPTTEEYQK